MTLVTRRAETRTGLPSPHAGAVGDDARQLMDRVVDALADIRSEGHRSAFTQLVDCLEECSQEGWDGEDAAEVLVQAFSNARHFLTLLPNAYPAPEVAADPDGDVLLDWIVSRQRMFSVSIGGGDRIAFAGLIDGNTIYGSERITDRFPPQLAEYLQRLHEEP